MDEAEHRRAVSRMRTVRSLAELAELVEEPRKLYVRYSLGPDGDRGRPSCDYESGLQMPGLSTHPLDPEPWWDRPVEDWLARQLCSYAHLRDKDEDRRPWVLAGPVVGRGPDNEPLVHPAEPVAWIAEEVVEEARVRYRERFDVARDSTG